MWPNGKRARAWAERQRIKGEAHHETKIRRLEGKAGRLEKQQLAETRISKARAARPPTRGAQLGKTIAKFAAQQAKTKPRPRTRTHAAPRDYYYKTVGKGKNKHRRKIYTQPHRDTRQETDIFGVGLGGGSSADAEDFVLGSRRGGGKKRGKDILDYL